YFTTLIKPHHTVTPCLPQFFSPRLAAGHGEWSEYSVERTARVVAGKFPSHAVWVVLPKAHIHGALASYDNFAATD
ncbi:unnamed protein product, partial [Laminaria digitata]